MIETAYKYKPAGQESPNRKRAHKQKDPLTAAFITYLDTITDFPYYYDAALRATKGFDDISELEINSLLTAAAGHDNIDLAGYFLSALYNRSDIVHIEFTENFITDGEELIGLGYKLKKGKTLVIRANVGSENAGHSDGTVLNYGTSIDLGRKATGTVVNYGLCHISSNTKTLINFGEIRSLYHQDLMKRQVAINFGKWGGFKHSYGPETIILNYGEANDRKQNDRFTMEMNKQECRDIRQLRYYLEDLRDKLHPSRPHTETIAALEKKDINKEIENILRLHGRYFEK